MRIPRLQPIPETRQEFQKNELPICQQDIRSLSQIHGEEVAETVRYATQVIRLQGGINPNAIKCVFPEGLDGRMDENELFRIVGNVAFWQTVEY